MATRRFLEIKTPLGDDLLFHRMRGREELGRLSEFEIDLLSAKGDLDFDKIAGKDVTVKLELPNDATRFFHGFVTRFVQRGTHGRYFAYHAVVSPWLWFLTRTANCRIFQEKTVPDILKEVLESHTASDMKFELTAHYRKWEYCVQYRETDFNFVSRLMEQEGIYYYFKHAEGRATMVLTDSYSGHEALKDYGQIPFIHAERSMRTDQERINEWQLAREIQPGAYVLTDFDFKKPSASLKVSHKIKRNHDRSSYEVFDFPGEYLETPDGDHYVHARLEELQCGFEVAQGSTNARGLSVGRLFKLTGQPRQDQNCEYLVLKTDLELEGGEYEAMSGGGAGNFSCRFTVIKSSEPFRPARITPKPIVQGPQTAIVVGPSGDEIYTDKYGRVKVQFQWDRYGKSDENSSCWIRVSHQWAGKNWGMIALPRMGQEVIVDFLEGDPDEPIITGRVYNAEQMPPYDLPGNKTQTGIKTRSSAKGSGANFNEIRFEDKKGSEQVYIHAEKNQDNMVENDATHTVGHDRTKSIGNDEKTSVGNNRTESVGVNESITIGSNRTEKVGANESVSVGANQSLAVGANQSESVGGAKTETIAIAKALTIGAGYQVTVGGAMNETVGAVKAEEIGGAKVVVVAGLSSENVGASKSTNAASNISESAGGNISNSAGGNIGHSAGSDYAASAAGKMGLSAGGDFAVSGGAKGSVDIATELTLKCGSASLVLKSGGEIQLKGTDLTFVGSGKISIKADGDVVIKGSTIHEN